MLDILNQISSQAISSSSSSKSSSSLSSNQQSAYPIIGAAPSARTFRRMVVTDNCQGSIWREVAVVNGDANRTEYFTYYLE